MTNPDPEQIAAGLTEAQRAAMTVDGLGDYCGSKEVYPSEGKDGPVMRSLIGLGLSGDGWPDRMTPLGLAVRNHLKGSDNG